MYEDPTVIVRCRVETVEYWKKALSWFFVHFELENKTQSNRMTEFISRIRRMECRGKGQRPKNMRPLLHREFLYLLQKLKERRARATIVHKFGLPAMLCYQFAMICRLDDATQLKIGNLRSHEKFPTVALQSQLTWSKNVREQRNAPWQSLLGSNRSVTYILDQMKIHRVNNTSPFMRY